MIIDNEKNSRTVFEWITEYVDQGKFDLVTGYFTVGALAYLSRHINEKIEEFRFVLGDIVSTDNLQLRTIDLLNENITVDAAFELSTLAQEAVAFLRQDKVSAKTLEPNFCHAKLYLFHSDFDPRHHYFISGSSNLTEAGIGLKQTQNVELNIAETGDNNSYKELASWFNELWEKKQAHTEKTIYDPDGKKYKKDFKQYLIDEIQMLFIKYTPRDLYYKVLFELFGHELLPEMEDIEFNRQVGRLENTTVYNSLYEFQKKGVLSLIKMLQKYNGAILADAVGLGKTWSALAVMKFFQLQGREVLLICPKKLEHNWRRYQRYQNSRFERDQFDYFVRYHTDLDFDRMNRYTDRSDKLFNEDKPKLVVIDESHNLRNDKSQRYKFLVEEILRKNEDIKVLMLSATPINNTLIDIRNQFKLMVQGYTWGFDDSLGIRNLDYTFRAAQKIFNQWRESVNPRIGEFRKELPDNFFKLTDSLTVARTRKMIEGLQSGLEFPVKEPPSRGGISENIFVTPKQIGNYESFEELFDQFPQRLSAYQPSFYVEQKDETDILHDERQRDFFLVKMMYILMVKRLESSWYSFKSTVKKILWHHQNVLDRIKAYEDANQDTEMDDSGEMSLFEDDELEEKVEEFSIGKKRKTSIAEIDSAGMLQFYKNDLKRDITSLDNLVTNLERFEKKIEGELKKPSNHSSTDDKLEVLIKKINQKRVETENSGNKKILIFTVYKDTAFYLFVQLKHRGFTNLAVVSGDVSKTYESESETKNYEPILERFCPFTKLFMEREWSFRPSADELPLKEKYVEWISWVAENDEKTYKKVKNPIDILIATDSLSEGQNLQDCDLVVNYDIHWNPVRVIQRMGRIDRLGSPNKIIYGVNFWPSDNINKYLDLQGRIEHRMAAMRLAGSEVQLEFSDTFREIAEDEDLEKKLNERMLRQMETTWDDIEVSDQNLGFDDLSLELFRQDLLEELKSRKNYYLEMPKGIYTGFKKDAEVCSDNGIIALLGYPSRPTKVTDFTYQDYELIYIDNNGKQVVINRKEVLDIIATHKDHTRYVPEDVDNGDAEAVNYLRDAVKMWLNSRAYEEVELEDGTVEKRMGSEPLDILEGLKKGNRDAIEKAKRNEKVSEKYKTLNFDLIAWFIVTE